MSVARQPTAAGGWVAAPQGLLLVCQPCADPWEATQVFTNGAVAICAGAVLEHVDSGAHPQPLDAGGQGAWQ